MSQPKLSLGSLGAIMRRAIHPLEEMALQTMVVKQQAENLISDNNDVITGAANGLRALAAQDHVLAALRDAVPALRGKGPLEVAFFTFTTTSLLRDGKDVLDDGHSVAWHANADGRDQRLRDMPRDAHVGLEEARKNFPLRKVLQSDIGRMTLSLAALFIGNRITLQVRTSAILEEREDLGYSVLERKVYLRFWPEEIPLILQSFLDEARKRWNIPPVLSVARYWDPPRSLRDVRAEPAPEPPRPKPSTCGCVADGPCWYCEAVLEPPAASGGAAEPPAEILCECTEEDLCGHCQDRWAAEQDAEAEARGDYEEDWGGCGYEAEVNHGADMEY